ncbi:hypothetical protein DL98DRAFT_649055 [Cadophora sp. DSE1049]|nr:hypothetical protein DL98DRAFT_649055 [Cadophora sp. DSE1049]
MPDFNELAEDVSHYAEEAKRGISNIAKRQWRPRFSNACRVCNDMDLKGHEGMQVVGWLPLLFTDIEDGARRGCCYCALLVNVCTHYVPGVDDWTRMSPRMELELKVQYRDMKLLEIDLTQNVPGQWLTTQGLRRLEIYAPNGHHIPFWPQLGNTLDLSSHSGSQECYDFLRTRIALCLRDHQGCKAIKTPLPTRVIDVELHSTQDVKLHEPRALEGTGRYIALSHCWGGHQIIKTTSSNLTAMKKTIKWDSLPHTFQDAISVARELQIRWVWIDSLCILQDDKADWEIEAAQMGTYYQKLFLPLRRLRRPILPPLSSAHEIPTTSTETSKSHTKATAIKSRLDRCYENDLWRTRWIKATRERSTSTNLDLCRPALGVGKRTHYRQGLYTTAQLGWSSNVKATKKFTSKIAADCPHPGSPVCLERFLPAAVSHLFSGTSLSRHIQSAVLHSPPISSLQLVVLQREYIRLQAPCILLDCGSMFSTRDLLWSADTWGIEKAGAFTRPPPTSTENGCPSCFPDFKFSHRRSWASLTGRLEYKSHFDLSGRSLITVLDTQVSLTSANPFGQVSSASITLTGSFITATINTPIPTGYYNYTMWPDQTYPKVWVNMTPDTVLENCQVQLQNGEVEPTLRRASVKAEGNPSVFGQVHCLMVYKDKGEVYGLVLVRSDVVPGAYARIGYTNGCGKWNTHKKEQRTITIV